MVSTPTPEPKNTTRAIKVRSTGATPKAKEKSESGPPISIRQPVTAPKLAYKHEKLPPTKEQIAVVEAAKSLKAGEGLAVIASAGTGKTECASMVISALIETHSDPDIIVTSFTTKAVDELKERLPKSSRTKIQTFSSLCLSVLRLSGFNVDIEHKNSSDKSKYRARSQSKSSTISNTVSGMLATSEVINAQYLRAINFGAWEIRQYAEGAVQRNGYNHRTKLVEVTAIQETEKNIDRQITIIDDPANRRRFVEMVKPILLNTIFNKLVDDDMKLDTGLSADKIETYQNVLSNQNISFQLSKDTAGLVGFLCDYLLQINPIDVTDKNYTFDWDGFLELYDGHLDSKGVYAVLEDLLDSDTFDNLPVCAGSIAADEDFQVFLATDPIISQIVNLKKANENIYSTVALLAQTFITKGLDVAKKEGVFTYNELMLCCKTFPINEIWPRYVLIDEAQDLSPLHHALLGKFISVGTSLIVIGDPNQSIFEWAGADSDSYSKLIKRFNCKVLPLSQSFRCGKNIIEYAKKFVPAIECGNDRLGIVTITDSWMFKGQYLKGDLVLSRTRLDATRAYFNFMRGVNNVNEGLFENEDSDVATVAYASGLNLDGAVREVVRRCMADGNSVEDLWSYCYKEINIMYQLVKDGKASSASREIFEKLSVVKMILQSLKDSGDKYKFYNNGEIISAVEKRFPAYAKAPADNECVRFLTVHKAKGSEANRCIVIDAPKFMPANNEGEDKELTEEQRLTYVMVTRAKNELIFCGGYPVGESSQGKAKTPEKKQESEESFFAEPELPENSDSYTF